MILDIVTYPDPRLKEVCKPITEVTDEIRQLAADMLETMYVAPGVGLAAPQVGHNIRMLVMDPAMKDEEKQPRVLINPELTLSGEEVISEQEGCLSVPGIYDTVERAERIRVRAWDQNGNAFTLEAQGLLSVCIQHEMDHLKGKVFVEYLSQLKQTRVRAKLAKQQRKSA